MHTWIPAPLSKMEIAIPIRIVIWMSAFGTIIDGATGECIDSGKYHALSFDCRLNRVAWRLITIFVRLILMHFYHSARPLVTDAECPALNAADAVAGLAGSDAGPGMPLDGADQKDTGSMLPDLHGPGLARHGQDRFNLRCARPQPDMHFIAAGAKPGTTTSPRQGAA